jgi:DNA replicative helicase MCM subunit Mcm2 (Cdc46/Mcm family)
MNNKKVLLRIVQGWNLNPKPEYRGFRCANCQKSIRKGWYHWLTTGGYKTPVHFCDECEKKFKLNKIKTEKPAIKVNKSKFIKFPEDIKSKFQKSVQKWNIKPKSICKIFACDNCGKNMFKAYHIWFVLKGTLVEVHFCKQCGNKINIKRSGLC